MPAREPVSQRLRWIAGPRELLAKRYSIVQSLGGKLLFSATDLSNFLACPHLTLLSRRTAQGGPKPRQFPDPGRDVLHQRGLEHEHNFLASLQKKGELHIADLTSCRSQSYGLERLQRHASATVEAMQAGADVIYQGCLTDDSWLGYPDFLRKVDRPSSLGNWSYEVVDTKLAREAKGGALLQVLLYADLLQAVQGVASEAVHLALGGPGAPLQSFRVTHYGAYFRAIRRRFLEHVAATTETLPLAVDPAPHCDICDWNYACTQERRDVDHLSFVAGITRQQRRSLKEGGIATLQNLGELDIGKAPRLEGVSPAALTRIHRQARIQLEGRRQNKPLHELLQPIVENQGLAALPPPSPGDLFFDLEGDPYAFELGIEYLFGVADAEGAYVARWSLDHPTERATFEWFIDDVLDRLQRHPDLHVYHYAPYEPTALKRLAGRYDTRIDEVDRLLRGHVFVDLFRVVRQGLRASVESYSIKKMEPFYSFEREVDLQQARSALANFEAWLQLGGTPDQASVLLTEIEGYNRDDCLSALELRRWLESLRDQCGRDRGEEVPRPVDPPHEAPKEPTEQLKAVQALMTRLTDGVPENAEERTPDQHGRWLLAQMLEYHRREDKAMWWRYFNWLNMSDEELVEDASALGGLEYVDVVGKEKQSLIHRYRFPAQEHDLGLGKALDPATESAVVIHAIDEAACTLDVKRGKASKAPHPRALFPDEHMPDEAMRSSLFRIGTAVADQGLDRGGPYPSTVDLILATPSRTGQPTGDPLTKTGEPSLDAARRLVSTLDHSVLPIQGPPGSGKTYTGARMILAELARGRKVGITATSHKVIGNLLKAVCEAAAKDRQRIHGIQKAKEEQRCGAGEIDATNDNAVVLEALQSGAKRLAAGTAWLWSREDMIGAVDVLFVDEAGQFSLANALAVAPAAKNLVLLGDPSQLQQPQQGLHPPGTDVSALDHLLQGHTTMPPDRGLFLAETWRLHPDICTFTSEVYYDGRLRPHPGLEVQRIKADAPATGSGLRWLPVVHSGNQNDAPEEVMAVAALIRALLDAQLTWTNRYNDEQKLNLNDILVVSPYNAQVSALEKALPIGTRVGTVDKFQGQEAPIVIYTMASSSAEDAPRGMEFLYSPNRLNVATSRAQCLVILVGSERLLFPECRTPQQMRLANGLCRYIELVSNSGSPERTIKELDSQR